MSNTHDENESNFLEIVINTIEKLKKKIEWYDFYDNRNIHKIQLLR